jgi:SAM-dependent methyltransferase
MKNNITPDERERHLKIAYPSPWVARFAPLAPKNAHVLDIAAGGGRHSQVFLNQGHLVTAIDKNITALSDMSHQKKIEIIEFDMETNTSMFAQGSPLFSQRFGAIIVVNYLYRPLFSSLIDALVPGGLFIYDSFALGNEAYARPRNPDHLLKSGELLELVSGQMQIVAYEHGIIRNADIPGVKQRLCAIKDLELSDRGDNEPPVHSI